MKKILGLLIFAAAVIFAANIDFGCRVFEVKSPNEIFIDLNKNLIFDETEPVKVQNLNYINADTDFEKYPVLNRLTEDEKFFLERMAFQEASYILKNRYVKFKDGDIFIKDKSYKDEMLLSEFVFDDTIASQTGLLDNLKTLNLDDYVILNLKNRKYHKLDCPLGRKSAKYIIVKLNEAEKTAQRCKNCILPERINNIVQISKELPIAEFKNNIFSLSGIKIFFLDLNSVYKPDNSCSHDACRALKKEIDNAECSIDIAVYGINNVPDIMSALINAYRRGVKIRRVYDYSEKKYYPDNDKLDSIMPDYKTDEECDKTRSSALMHNKYFIFDDKKVFTGSSNISSTDLSGFNANYAVLINSKEIAAKYKEDFEQMYSGIFHKGKKSSGRCFIETAPGVKIMPLFSPQDKIIDIELVPLINSAEKYIYAPAFFITHKGLSEALINAKNRGLDVKIIIDAVNAGTKYSVHKKLRQAGIQVKTENYAGKMHSKTFIIDDKYTLTGSMNFTRSGNSKNDENAILIESPEIAKFMRGTFMYLWNKIPEKYLTTDPKAESIQSIGACSDGIDNDFDGKTDASDEGCKTSCRH